MVGDLLLNAQKLFRHEVDLDFQLIHFLPVGLFVKFQGSLQ